MTDFWIDDSGNAAPDFCAGLSVLAVKAALPAAQVLTALREPV
jgi:hypothetical protein